MTCCIAIPMVKHGRVVLAAGSRIMSESALCPPVRKLHPLGSGWHCAAAGDLAAIQAVVSALRSATLTRDEDIRRCVADACPESDDGIELLIARRDVLLCVGGDGATTASGRAEAIGEGAHMALGFLGASKAPETVEGARRLAKRALKFVETRSVCEGPPYRTRVV